MRCSLACFANEFLFNGRNSFRRFGQAAAQQGRGGGGLLRVFLMRGKWPADTIPTPCPPRLQIDTSRKSVQRNVRVFRGGPPGGQ